MLRSVRIRKRLSLRDVEAGTAHEFKASVLGAYERGDRSISVPRLQRLAWFYRVSIDELLEEDARRAPSEETSGPGSPRRHLDLVTAERSERRYGHDRTPVCIDLDRVETLPVPEREVLRRYLDVIVTRRGIVGTRMLTVRADDVAVIASLLHVPGDRVPDLLAVLEGSR